MNRRKIFYQFGAASKYADSPLKPKWWGRGWRRFRKHRYEVNQ